MALIVAILTSLVLLFIAAFAIDLGMQRAGRRDMQALADMVALDMGRLINGRTRAEIEAGDSDNPSATAQLSWSVANNDDYTVGNAPTVTAYWVDVADDGSYPQANGVPVQVASTEVPNGVVVRAGADVALAFAGVTGASEDGVERSAVATAEESACFRIGSYAARLNTTNSALLNTVLAGLLGGGVNLSTVAYSGIADANVDLFDLATHLGLGTVDQLLTTDVTAGDLLIAAADLLAADGVANANVLNSVAAHAGGISVKLGSIVSAEPGAGAAETATINAVDLLVGTVFVASGANAVSVPGLAASLPLTSTNLTTSLSVIEKPQTRCGKRGSSASTAQVALSVGGTLVSGHSALGLPISGTAAVATDVASAQGVLTDILCGEETIAEPSGEDVDVTSGLAGASAQVNLSVNATTSASGDVNGLISGITSLLNLLGLNRIASITISGSVGLKAQTTDPSTVRTAQIRVPNSPPTWNDPVSLGSGDLQLNTTNVTTTTNTLTVKAKNFLGLNVTLSASETAGILANFVRAATTSVLNPLVSSVNSSILQPLQDLLGIDLGGADVFGQRPYCSNPVLVG